MPGDRAGTRGHPPLLSGAAAADGSRLAFAYQEEPRGTADAVAAAEAFADGDVFAVINSDTYYPVEASAALRSVGLRGGLFERDAMLAGSNVPEERIRRFAVAKIDPQGNLERIIEKPDEATLAALPRPLWLSMNCWRFGPVDLSRRAAAIRPSPRGELEIPDAVQHAINALGETFLAADHPRAGVGPDQPRRHRLRGGDSGGHGGETVIELWYPGDLADTDELASQISTTGLSPRPASRRRGCSPRRRPPCRSPPRPTARPPLALFVPGRIEVLGKHTDYAGGRTMVAAVERGFASSPCPATTGRSWSSTPRSGETDRLSGRPRAGAADRLVGELPDDRGPAHARGTFPARAAAPTSR